MLGPVITHLEEQIFLIKLVTPKTTTYGLNSFKYFAAKNWNSLPESVRTEPTMLSFKQKITNLSFEL